MDPNEKYNYVAILDTRFKDGKLQVLLSWEATWIEATRSYREWDASWEPWTTLCDPSDLDEALIVDEEQVQAWDDKVQALIDAAIDVGSRVIAEVDGKTFAATVTAVSTNELSVDAPAGVDVCLVTREQVYAKAPPPTTVRIGTAVRAACPEEVDGQEARVWHYGKVTKVLAGGEVVVIDFDRDDVPESAVCVFDVQEAKTGKWLTSL